MRKQLYIKLFIILSVGFLNLSSENFETHKEYIKEIFNQKNIENIENQLSFLRIHIKTKKSQRELSRMIPSATIKKRRINIPKLIEHVNQYIGRLNIEKELIEQHKQEIETKTTANETLQTENQTLQRENKTLQTTNARLNEINGDIDNAKKILLE